jgi:hypothetical protein
MAVRPQESPPSQWVTAAPGAFAIRRALDVRWQAGSNVREVGHRARYSSIRFLDTRGDPGDTGQPYQADGFMSSGGFQDGDVADILTREQIEPVPELAPRLDLLFLLHCTLVDPPHPILV